MPQERRCRRALVRLGHAAGFSLSDIAAIFTNQGEPRIDRERLLAKAEELEDSIARLIAMRDGLRHAAHCHAPSHMGCPTFRRLLKLAGKGRLDAPPRPRKSKAAP